ncbi:MAG TPA: hypothetical protein EYQ75_22085 [Planctomycetaceae bacterium]|nr:hypothetical protein [Planctomycetaceae bacterium]
MPDPLLYLKATGVAAIVSVAFALAMTRARRCVSTSWLNSVSVLGLSLGLGSGYYVLSLRLAWPPANGLDRFLTIVVPAALIVELLAGFQRVPRWFAWTLRMSLVVAIPRILVHGSVYLSDAGDWTIWQAVWTMVVCSALLAGTWCLLAWLYRRSPGVSIPLALSLATQSAGLTVMMAGYIKGGAAAFPFVATIMATAMTMKLLNRRMSSSETNDGALENVPIPATIGIGLVGLFGCLFIGLFFGRLSSGNATAMLVAPLLCWTTETPLFRHRKPWLVGSLRLALVAIPLVIVLAMAKSKFDREMAPLLGNAAEMRHEIFVGQ